MGPDNLASIQLLSLIILLGICYCQSFELEVVCHKTQRNALLKFKQGLIDPSNRLSSWVGEDCCGWRGVTCNNRTGNVFKLELGNLFSDGAGKVPELGGKIDPALSDLKDLSYLDLSMNNFAGIRIPEFFGSLSKLTYLNLSGAAFGGLIPPSLGNLSRLQFLDLSNKYKEPIETDLIWLSNLSSLKHLNLAGVSLTKAASYWHQVINMLPSLLVLNLGECGLSNLPLSFPFENLTSLSVLDLSQNGFSWKIPLWFSNMSSLEYLNLKSNDLQGEIPSSFVNLHSLKHLDLSENSFIRGKLTKDLGKLCNLQTLKLSVNQINSEITDFIDSLSGCKNSSSLESLYLGYNDLEGNLPVSLGYLKNLRLLYLWHNSFEGLIPPSIGNLSNLEELSLSYNKMTGSFPESLGQLSLLVSLDLSENLWEGVVSEASFANLSSLQELELYKESPNISLAFNFSYAWIPPFKLTYIRIRSCQLGPKFPAWLQNQNELTTLILNNARISDTMPDWFWQLGLLVDELDIAYNELKGKIPNSSGFQSASVVDLSSNNFEGPLPLWSSAMEKLYLRDNKFSGPIPEGIGEVMPFLTDLDISFNSLNGSIPLSIGDLNTLTTLVISNNNLSGEIPRFWRNMPFLYILDMSNNTFSGTIPESIGSLTELKFLILCNNNLSGELPPSMSNCSLLDSLDLGDNKFSGNIPSWIGESMRSLLILRLRSNFFSGNFPTTICTLSNLHILDFSHNNLSGRIPPCIGNLTGLKTELTDLDTVRYQGRLRIVAKGRILEYFSTLYLVNNLDLSGNYLTGQIPSELTKLVRLWSLNFSSNHLTGRIPLQIGQLAKLETLDLSRNKLFGPIPQTMTLLTFLNHLDLSYNNLSGKIPTSNQLQTLPNASIYEGNSGLCGLPLPTKCPGDGDGETETPPVPGLDDGNNDEDDDLEKIWFFLTVGLGFVAGFWGVCGSLAIKQSWRRAYFNFIDESKDKLVKLVSQIASRFSCNH